MDVYEAISKAFFVLFRNRLDKDTKECVNLTVAILSIHYFLPDITETASVSVCHETM